MAIYSFQCSIISRTQKTNNAVGKAAYINRCDMKNEYDGTTWKFQNRSEDVGYSAVMLPENCPDRFSDPNVLWNEVETFEKRKDARLARDFVIALPNELSLEQNKALVEDFIKTNFTDEGMIANYAIHTDDPNNIHCHIMITTREVNNEGFAKTNTKGREWNKPEYLNKWRQSFADITNKHLAENNINAKVDHRSVEKQKEEAMNKAVNAESEKEKLEHLRDFMKLENVKVQERVSRKEFENNPAIQVERAELKKQTLERNKEVDNLINSKIVDLKRVKPETPKSAPKQQPQKRSSKMFNMLDTISNLYEELKSSVTRAFNKPEPVMKAPSLKSVSSSSKKKKKKQEQDDEFNGNVIDAVQLREEEQLKNNAPKPNNNADEEVNNDKKLSPAQQFAKDKKTMKFAYQSDNLENFVVASEVAKNKRPNAMRAIGTIPKPNGRQYFNNDNEAKNGFSKFLDKQNEKTEDRKNTAEQKKKNDNQPKSMQDFEKKQNANIQNRQNANNTQKSENKASAPKAPSR
ncbi:MobA/MobL family protein [Salmonella enterica]|nr:MobA/MobL family protein [Salmonella enterica]